MPNPDLIQYVKRPEFREEWEARPVQFAPTISAVPPTSPEEVTSQAVTRGQKRKQEVERFVGEGSGKNITLDYVNLLNDLDMAANREQSDEEGSEEGEVRKKDKGKGKVDEGKEGQKQGGKEDAGEQDKEKEQRMWMMSTIPMLTTIWSTNPTSSENENKETSLGKCYFKALEDDKTFAMARSFAILSTRTSMGSSSNATPAKTTIAYTFQMADVR